MRTSEEKEVKRRRKSAREKRHEEQIRSRQQNVEEWRKLRPGRKTFIACHGLNTFDETSVKEHDIGQMTYACSECGALMFKEEKSNMSPSTENSPAKFSLCCSYDAIKLPPIKEPPETLNQLLTGSNKRDQDFQTNIRTYNSSLAFASMGLTQKEYKFKTKGPYCFRISGQIYHTLSQMHPEPGKIPKFSQMYIYDHQNNLDNCLQSFQNLERTVLKELQEMIKEVNPYAHLYKQAGYIMRENPTEDVKLVLRAHDDKTNVDPWRYNLPTGTDVTVILPVDTQNTLERDVIVYKNAASHPNGKYLMNIKATHSMYDPLMYVLMFPFGDLGWERDYRSGGKKYSAMQYYKYKLMIHGNCSFNAIHRMGRLFQQYVVDIYAKIEDGRLQFIRGNQSKL